MISVIIPIYNVENYLRNCLNSLKQQTYDDFEVLMIDDGSTDYSAKIAAEFTTDKRFKLFKKTNGGQGQAKNLGLDNASGDYYCFIDSDDYVEPNYLEILYNLLVQYDADISQCAVSRVWENGRKQPYYYTGMCDGIYDDIKKYISQSSFVMWNKLYKRHLFEDLRFPEGIKFEDFALAPQVYEKANLIASTSKPLYNYLWRNNSTTTIVRVQPDILKAQNVLENSAFGKRNPDIMQLFYVRQIIGSLLKSMILDKDSIKQVEAIMEEGIEKYPHIRATKYRGKTDGFNQITIELILKGHYRMAHYYARAYDCIYNKIRQIYRAFKG